MYNIAIFPEYTRHNVLINQRSILFQRLCVCFHPVVISTHIVYHNFLCYMCIAWVFVHFHINLSLLIIQLREITFVNLLWGNGMRETWGTGQINMDWVVQYSRFLG